ncbi:MAG: hypothetical protein LAO24_14350 [Acidobacteriia bacterium]|nr:hypothetical protein [Terriglobia bacterium]
MRGPLCTSLALGLCLLWAGCATVGPPQPPSLELPKPPSDLRATRKGGKVLLTWTIPASTTDRQSVHSLGATRICRGLDKVLQSCGTPVGEAPPPPNLADVRKSSGQKVAGSYGDSLPSDLQRGNPLGSMTYAVEVLNANGRSAGLSNQVQAPLVPTLPSPADFNARVTGEGVALTWTAPLPSEPQPAARYVYRVYRRAEGVQQRILVGEVAATTGSNFTLTDPSIEWEKTYYYHVTTLTAIAQPGKAEIQVEGDDSPEVKVFADDVFPPAVPSGLQAVFSGPGQEPFIDLIWAPVTDVDLAGYNVYRHEEGKAPERVNSEPVKTPAYRDKSVAAGKQYFYSISAVDARGNESTRSEEASERVP